MMRSARSIMQVYLLRHGIAEDPRPGVPDEARPLVPEGRRKLEDTLRAAMSAGLAPDLILTSPYRRAVETAEIAARILGHARDLVPCRALTPDSQPEPAWREISAARAEQVLVASHQPLCGWLLGYLLGYESLRVDFKKGAIARIDVPAITGPPRGTLQWLLTARLAAR